MEENKSVLTITRLSHKEIQLLLNNNEKRLFDLISIGQDYLDEKYIEAKFDMFATMIKSCVQITLDQEHYRSLNIDVSNASGRWIIPVLAAGTLQVDNSLFYLVRERLKQEEIDPSNKSNQSRIATIKGQIEKEQKHIWREKALQHRKMCQPHLEKLIKAGQVTISAETQQKCSLQQCHDKLLHFMLGYMSSDTYKTLPPGKKSNYHKCLKLLLTAGYDPHTTHNNNQSCIDLAMTNCDEEVLILLQDFNKHQLQQTNSNNPNNITSI